MAGYLPAKQYGAYPRADASGVTDAMLHWICSASATSLDINGTVVKEAMTPSETMITGLTAGGDRVTSCPETDQFPSLSSTSAYWVAGTSPQDQLAKGMEPVLPALNTNGGGVDVFAPMNWAWANYLGLGSAALANGAGHFVAPSATSVYAALGEATTNADGTVTPNYATGADPGGYVMPAVVYAVVSLSKPTASLKGAASVLEDILALTGQPSGPSGPKSLPEGLLPLTPALAAHAQALMKQLDAVAAPTGSKQSPAGGAGGTSPPPGGSTSGSGPSGGSVPIEGSAAFAGPTGFADDAVGSGSAGNLTSSVVPPSVSPGTGSASTSGGKGNVGIGLPGAHRRTRPTASANPLYGPIELAASASRLMLPALLTLGALGVVLGAFFLWSRSLRDLARRLFRRKRPGPPQTLDATGHEAPMEIHAAAPGAESQ